MQLNSKEYDLPKNPPASILISSGVREVPDLPRKEVPILAVSSNIGRPTVHHPNPLGRIVLKLFIVGAGDSLNMGRLPNLDSHAL